MKPSFLRAGSSIPPSHLVRYLCAPFIIWAGEGTGLGNLCKASKAGCALNSKLLLFQFSFFQGLLTLNQELGWWGWSRHWACKGAGRNPERLWGERTQRGWRSGRHPGKGSCLSPVVSLCDGDNGDSDEDCDSGGDDFDDGDNDGTVKKNIICRASYARCGLRTSVCGRYHVFPPTSSLWPLHPTSCVFSSTPCVFGLRMGQV